MTDVADLLEPFSNKRLKAFVPVLRAKARRLADVLGHQRDVLNEVEAETNIWKTVLDVIGIETLGIDLNHLESDRSPLHRLFSRTMQQSLVSHIIHYFSSYLPLRHLIPIRANSDFLQSCGEVRDFIWGHVRARRLAMKDGPAKGETKDALQCMIEEGGSLWEDADIVEYVMNLMVLGTCIFCWSGANTNRSRT